jgi:hypothetical protein
MQFLKMFGLGILYALLFPFLCVFLVLFAVYGVIVFLVEFVIMLVNFFSGKKLFPPYPEDLKAYQILTALSQQALNAGTPQPAQTNVYLQQNYYPGQGQPGVPGMGQPANPQVAPQPQPPYQQMGGPAQGQYPNQSPYQNQLPPQQPYGISHSAQPGQIPQQQQANPLDVIDTSAEDKK